jgi:hypothetical protein
VPVAEYLRLPVLYFADRLVLGSRAFVNAIFVTFRDGSGPKRRRCAADAGSVCAVVCDALFG